MKRQQSSVRSDVDGRQIIVYKLVVEISEENKGALQFLDLISTIDKYSEVTGDEFATKISAFITMVGVDFELVKNICICFQTEHIEIFIKEV